MRIFHWIDGRRALLLRVQRLPCPALVGGSLLIVSLAACAPVAPARARADNARHDVEAAPPHPAVALELEAAPPSSSQPAADSARLVDTAPPDLPPEIAERVAFLSELCPVALHYDVALPHAVAAGCRTCPPFEGASAAPDGKIALGGDEFFALELLVSGHFTDAAAEQRLAVFNGCESHSENWGGTLLAQRENGHFKALAYASGIHPQSCKLYRRPGQRDIPICEFSDAHQSVATDSLASLDYSSSPPALHALFQLVSRDGCLMEPGAKTAVTQNIRSFQFDERASAGLLIVRIEQTTETLNADYATYCQLRAQSEQPIEPPPAKHEQLERRFRFDGRAFVAR
jgi:hypothetical protein